MAPAHSASRGSQRRRSARHPKSARGRSHWLYGRHAVEAALSNPRRTIDRVLATAEFSKKYSQEIPGLKQAESVDRRMLDELLGASAVHQGVAALVAPLPLIGVEELLTLLPEDKPAQIIILDEVTDPRNVGAILRSAAALGAAAVIVTRHNAAEENGALAKAASGALDLLPVAEAGNLRRDLELLKAAGFWCLGLGHPAPRLLGQDPPPERLAWVLGAEGRGLRRLTAETCDSLVAIPIADTMESLNVSNAAAIALYEWTRTHGLPETITPPGFPSEEHIDC